MYYPPTWKQLHPKAVTPHPVTAAGGAVDLVVLHHTVTDDEPFFAILRQVERMHINGNFDDFAYNGASSNTEEAYTDGRGPLVQGGATGNGVDRYSLSVVAVGDFHTASGQVPTNLLVTNTASLIARWIKLGHVTRDFKLAPHRDYYATACCGDRLVKRIPEIEKLAKELAAEEDPEEEDMTPMSEWWKTYNRAGRWEFHPHLEFIQSGLKSMGLYRGPVTGKKNDRTVAGWEAFERSVDGTDNNGQAGQKSWDLFLLAVFARDSGHVPTSLLVSIDQAVAAVDALEAEAEKVT